MYYDYIVSAAAKQDAGGICYWGKHNLYDWLCGRIDACFERERTLKENSRGSVELLRHKRTGQRVICRRYAGSGEVYRRLMGVSSPNLPAVFETAERDGRVITLEEYITGDTLDALLRGCPLTEGETRRIVRDVCAGLWVLHSMAAVHRDVKPENIILSGDRTVLIDFDSARMNKPEAAGDTRVLGTIGYAAPEQFGLAQSDCRTDIYAVGVLLNVMLTGEHPSKRLAAGRLGRVVSRCTMMDPNKRYRDIPHLLPEL